MTDWKVSGAFTVLIFTRAKLPSKIEKIAFILHECCKKLYLCTVMLNDSDLLKRVIYK